MIVLRKVAVLFLGMSFFTLPLSASAKEEPTSATEPANTTKEVVPGTETTVEKVQEEKSPVTVEKKSDVEQVDINTADAETFDRLLEGIGVKKAEAIVKYREDHGPFKEITDLLEVNGIGEKTLEKNKDRLTLSLPKETAEKSKESAPAKPTEETAEPPVVEDTETETN